MTSPKAIQTIRAYYNDPDDLVSKKFFDWAAKQNAPRESTVSQIQKGAGLERPFVIMAMKNLQKLRFGKFTIGRRTKESRITWDVNLGDLGKCAQGADIDFDEPITSHSTPQGPNGAGAGESHVLILRPGLRILLPSDLTRGEARRVADFALSVPFDRAGPTDR